MKTYGIRLVIVATLAALSACTGAPDGVRAVEGFKVESYLGQWYEIARLDHSFERDMIGVTAEYSLRDDGGLTVLNRGFKTDAQLWSDAEGKAFFVGKNDTGHLKVSFFGPFYGSYIIFDVGREEEDYQYAFVSGMNTDYLWLLSRTPTVSDKLLSDFKLRATELGFDTTQLIIVDQSIHQKNR
ncbi:MAG: lipocalin family protein [Porticoccaceae bacterium]|nr:lipocalin family protein [Porticoccaceae bacterium]